MTEADKAFLNAQKIYMEFGHEIISCSKNKDGDYGLKMIYSIPVVSIDITFERTKE